MVSYKKKYLTLLQELEKMELKKEDEPEESKGDKDKKLEKVLEGIAKHGDTITNVTIYTMVAAYANQIGFNPLYGVVALKLATSISEVAAGVGIAMLASMGIKGLSSPLREDVLKVVLKPVFPPADYIPLMKRVIEELGESAKILIPKLPWGQLEEGK
jgi:hypothetical protein